MALSVKNMLGGGGAFYPSVFATGVSQSDDVRLFKVQKRVMEDLIPHLTADTSECLVYNLAIYSGYHKYYAFDGDDSTCVYGTGSSFPRGYGYDLSEVKYIDSIKMYAHTFSGNAVTYGMAIQVSDDGTTWKDVKTWSETVSGNAYFARQDAHVGVYARYVRVVQTSLSISNSGTFMLHDLRVIGNTEPFDPVKEITNKKWIVKGADVLQSGYVFKLNELGMYRLSADNGTVTKTQDVLVDYPLEYVAMITYSIPIPMSTMALSTPSPTTNTAGISRTFTLDTLIKGYKTDGGYLASGVNSYTVNSDDSIYVKSSTSAGGYGIGVVKKLEVGQYKFSFNASWSGAYSSFSILGYAESGTFHAYITDRSALANGYNEFTFDVLASYPIIVIVYSSAYNGNCTFSDIVLETI